MVFNLQGRRGDPSVAEKIHDELPGEIADADAAGQPLIDEGLHGCPGFLDRSATRDNIFTIVGETGGISV